MNTRDLACFSILLGLNLGCSGDIDEGDEDDSATFEPAPRRPAPPPPVAPTATGMRAAQPAPASTPVILASLTAPPATPLPPAAPPIVRALDVTIWTGGDDLRGGNDSAYLTLFLDDGRWLRTSVNDGFRLADNTYRTVRVTIAGGVLRETLGYFTVCGTMTGGIGGDNWNIDRIHVQAVSEAGSQAIFDTLGTPPPLARLTGEQRCTPAYTL